MNYDRYSFSRMELFMYGVLGLITDALISWAFFRSAAAFFILMIPVFFFFFRTVRMSLLEKMRYEFSLEFREALLSVQSSLNAGYSVENAFIEAEKVMEDMFGESKVTTELKMLTRRLRSNEALEKILSDLADRSGIEDVEDFANVFYAAKRSGGDFTRIIRKAVDSISDKMEVRRDIRTGISAKRYENRIMEIVPFGIIVYLNLTSSGFLSPLYHNVKGNIIMAFCLVLYASGVAMAEHIMREAEKV